MGYFSSSHLPNDGSVTLKGEGPWDIFYHKSMNKSFDQNSQQRV